MRRYDTWRSEVIQAVNELEEALGDAYAAKLLPHSICEAVATLNSEKSRPFLWAIFGYLGPYVGPYVDESLNCEDAEGLYLTLEPGFISLEWPDVFSPLGYQRLDDFPSMSDAVDVAITEQRFRMLGYYATACDLIAKWIEDRVDDHPTVGLTPANLSDERSHHFSFNVPIEALSGLLTDRSNERLAIVGEQTEVLNGKKTDEPMPLLTVRMIERCFVRADGKTLKDQAIRNALKGTEAVDGFEVQHFTLHSVAARLNPKGYHYDPSKLPFTDA